MTADRPAAASQRAHKARMAPRKDSPPGLEVDSHGDPIPFDQRTEDDQQKARAAQQKA